MDSSIERGELTALVKRCTVGDQVAFEQLYRNTSPYLNALATRIVGSKSMADEILQEAFIQIWQNISKFDAERGSPMGWLTSIVRSRALDRIRHEKSQSSRVEKASLEPMFSALEEEPASGRFSAEFRKLRDCLQPISAEQRRSIVLAYCYGLTHSELAQSLKAPIGTVKSWVRRGLNSVRQCMNS